MLSDLENSFAVPAAWLVEPKMFKSSVISRRIAYDQ